MSRKSYDGPSIPCTGRPIPWLAVVAALLLLFGGGSAVWVFADSEVTVKPGIVSERPDFGSMQIQSLDQLRYGVPVMMCRRDICSDVRRVVQAPYVDEKDGSLRIKVFLKDERGFRNESVSLADWGVVPYPGGGWNATNWLMKVTE